MIRPAALIGHATLPSALSLATLLAAPNPSYAQASSAPPVSETPSRPLPGPVVPPPAFRAAVENGTRTETGRPGPGYWQQHTRYSIDVTLDPATGVVSGSEVVVHENRSPEELQALVLNLYQNLHAPGVVRNEAQEVTGGITLERVVVEGVGLSEGSLRRGPAYWVDGTVMVVRPPEPVLPGRSIELEIDWSFTVPASGAGRMGHSDREVYFIAYWFPRIAVFDDLRGWDAQPYLAGSEFYDGFGDFDVSITVPAGWTVMATGDLLNPSDVFTAQTIERMARALESDTIVPIATRADRNDGNVTVAAPSGGLGYRFSARNVRDFTWTASNVQLWSGTRALVPDRDGDGEADRVAIHSFFREDRGPLWRQQALYGKHAIEHHSRYTGFSYPWPHMTSVEGADIIGGGMEFPMLTLIGPYTGRSPEALYSVTSHELAHMWIPMIVGTNEKRHAWMDEGFTSFLENQGRPEYYPGTPADSIDAESYLTVARAEMESPLMTHGDYYEPGPGYGTASYPKPATLLVTLRNLLGEETFNEAYRSYVADWAFKHPAPWDFFNAVERAAIRDLDWFWDSWYYQTWRLDHAAGGVRNVDGQAVVRVLDRGFAPMPARVRVELRSGEVRELEVPVSHWLSGATEAELPLGVPAADVMRVEVDAEHLFPDVDRSNNTWTKS